MKNNIILNKLCSGCGVCEGICPHTAIKIILNSEGFYRPIVDENKCKECKLCLNICPFSNENYNPKLFKDISNKSVFGEIKEVYAGWAKDKYIREKSASGGIATALALACLNKLEFTGVSVTYLNDNFEMVSEIVRTREDILKGLTSKYIPSNFSNISKSIVDSKPYDKFLVIGLPCQIVALKNYIFKQKIDTDKIIFMDLICGRINSKILTELYIKNKIDIKNVKSINFRVKQPSWWRHSIKIVTKDGDEISEEFLDSLFGKVLVSRVMSQKACYRCTYEAAGSSDITLSNFWNLKYKEENMGVSLVIVRTDSGKQFLSKLNDEVNLIKEEKKYVELCQPHFLDNRKNKDYKKIEKVNEEVFKLISTKPNISLDEIYKIIKLRLKINLYTKIKRKMKRILNKI